jgi:hypothetical protein
MLFHIPVGLNRGKQLVDFANTMVPVSAFPDILHHDPDMIEFLLNYKTRTFGSIARDFVIFSSRRLHDFSGYLASGRL